MGALAILGRWCDLGGSEDLLLKIKDGEGIEIDLKGRSSFGMS